MRPNGCYMSQSAASAHVRAIEEHLGTQLFVRTNRNLELTHAGELVARKARTLLNEEALFKTFARELRGKIEGKLAIGTSSEPGTRIGEVLAALRTNHPLVRIDVFARPSYMARQGLMSGELDVGVLLGSPVEPDFAYYEIATVQYRVAGPAAWKDQIDSADWAELAALPWITPSASSAYTPVLRKLFEDRGLELNSVIRIDNSSIGRAALQAGAGLMLLRGDHAVKGEQDGYLAISPVAQAEMTLSIAHQAARKDDPLVQAFLEAAKGPWPDLKLVEREGATQLERT